MASNSNQLEYISVKPDLPLSKIVESIWMVKNHSNDSKEGVLVPDGKIDLFLFADEQGNFEIFYSGICSVPIKKPPFPRSVMFAVSFYPLAAEYIFKRSFAGLHNTKEILPNNFWGFSREDLNDFEQFIQKANSIINELLIKEIDGRKENLFHLIYEAKGEITVGEIEEKVSWSNRQINRYFQKWIGITLKSYINIVRFSNSLKQLKMGEFYPELNYGDQSHFIREVKKFSGVKPSHLNKNENDRFIQFSLMPEE